MRCRPQMIASAVANMTSPETYREKCVADEKSDEMEEKDAHDVFCSPAGQGGMCHIAADVDHSHAKNGGRGLRTLDLVTLPLPPPRAST